MVGLAGGDGFVPSRSGNRGTGPVRQLSVRGGQNGVDDLLQPLWFQRRTCLEDIDDSLGRRIRASKHPHSFLDFPLSQENHGFVVEGVLGALAELQELQGSVGASSQLIGDPTGAKELVAGVEGQRRIAIFDRLASNQVNLLETRLGPLDAMQSICSGWVWIDLVQRSRVLRVGNLDLRVLELASIVESKVVADREKDRAMLPVLRRTLEEK